ncbi:MAG: hypothetical protein JWO49_1290 [Arthrobacter sp.]|nr:hypothetical protein [Arthrobacter sp.]MCU1547442.1 hypothetical protein [Arthrobacter sp.]
MHNNVVFPDFSAFHMTLAGAPAARVPSGHRPEGALDQDPAPSQVSALGGGTARVAAPPFSWLGADAWPNFPAS